MTHFLQLLLLLTVIVSAAKLAGALANRLGQPAVFGEILVGLVLGPTVLDVLGWPLFATTAEAGGGESAGLLPVLRDLSEIGVVLLMFVAGLETDVVELRRVGKVAFWAAFGGVVLPLLGGAAVAVAFGFPLYWEGIFIGAILTATSVSISAQTLIELGALRSREGATILGAAVIDDVMGIIVLSLVVAFARASAGGVDVAPDCDCCRADRRVFRRSPLLQADGCPTCFDGRRRSASARRARGRGRQSRSSIRGRPNISEPWPRLRARTLPVC